MTSQIFDLTAEIMQLPSTEIGKAEEKHLGKVEEEESIKSSVFNVLSSNY